MRVIIADDEDKVCQLIYKLVNWEELKMEVVAIVHNGIEALQAIEKHRPNIVITDIRMPGYDGLELIRLAKEIDEKIGFIIISGYRHFEYAQSAIKYGVKDYLLKPIKKDELENTLLIMKKNYEQECVKISSEEKYIITIKNNLDKLRAAFFTEILFKKRRTKEEMILEDINNEYHFEFKEGKFQIIVIKIDGIDVSNQSNLSYIEEKVLHILNTRLRVQCFESEYCFERNQCIAVLNYSEEKRKLIRKTLKAMLDELLLQKDIFQNICVTIGAGIVVKKLSDIAISQKSAIWAKEQRLIAGTNKVIEGVNVSSNELASSHLFNEFNVHMPVALERLDETVVTNTLYELRDNLLKKEDISGHDILQMAKEAMNLYLFCMRKDKISIPNSDAFFDSFQEQVENLGSAQELFDYLINTITTSFQGVIEAKKQNDYKPIRDAKLFIQENYMNPISLEIVSGTVGFNSTYFSSLFKKETGDTFLQYLTSYRMEKAKELLKDTNYSVGAICQMVGYNDTKNFTKGFAKYTNLKPNEYRKIYS